MHAGTTPPPLAGYRPACADTGGDPGTGRAMAVAFAREGADVAISYLSGQEDQDARHTAGLAGQRCVTIRAGLAEEATCQHVVKQAVQELGGLDVLVNSVATQQPVSGFTELSTRQLERTFRASIFSYLWTSRAPSAPA